MIIKPVASACQKSTIYLCIAIKKSWEKRIMENWEKRCVFFLADDQAEKDVVGKCLSRFLFI